MKTLKKIDPYQAGKVSGIIYFLISLLFIPFLLLFAIFAPDTDNELGIVGSIGMAIFLPILYGVMGFIFGALGAWIYNVTFGLHGGIKVEVS